jgi:hypothetical protein
MDVSEVNCFFQKFFGFFKKGHFKMSIFQKRPQRFEKNNAFVTQSIMV